MLDFARIQEQALSLDTFDPIESFPECGGIDIFMGTVRNHHEGKAVKSLKYTSYKPLSEKMIREIELEIEKLNAVPTTAYPTPARRPQNSRLNTEKFQRNFGLVLPVWDVGVKRMLTELFSAESI